jgi:hypothetical protein
MSEQPFAGLDVSGAEHVATSSPRITPRTLFRLAGREVPVEDSLDLPGEALPAAR